MKQDSNAQVDVNAEYDLQDAFSNNAHTETEPQVEQTEPEPVVEEPKKKEDPFSVKFAALSRKEKALKQQERELNRRLQELEAKTKTVEEPKTPEAPPLEYRLKRDPLGTLKELGFTYEKLAELVSNDGKLPQEMQLELIRQEIEEKYNKEIQTIKDELLNRDKKSEEERYAQTIENFKSELTSFVESSPEDYELIQANDAVDLVYQVIEQHHAETGQILSNKEAADHVEAYLFEEAQKLLEKSKKLKSIATPQPKQVKPSSPTLSNNLSNNVNSNINSSKLTDEQSKFEAAKLIKWNE